MLPTAVDDAQGTIRKNMVARLGGLRIR